MKCGRRALGLPPGRVLDYASDWLLPRAAFDGPFDALAENAETTDLFDRVAGASFPRVLAMTPCGESSIDC